jgi:hypothetical protein
MGFCAGLMRAQRKKSEFAVRKNPIFVIIISENSHQFKRYSSFIKKAVPEFMTEAVAALPSRDEFSKRLNTTYSVRSEIGAEFEAELVELKVLVSNDRQENFSLLFRTAVGVPAVQGIYTFEAAGSDTLDIFLVPISKDKESLYFEAVFNYLKDKVA